MGTLTEAARATETWQDEVRRLAREQDAIVLAHNYMPAEIQDAADVVGDSLALARHAAATGASTIVLCGVLFMAETAKILSPDKRVLVPTADAGCSLADGVTAADVRRWRAEHPGAVVVAYVNTTAAVKAEVDLCCTSANAVDVVRSVPEDRPVLFLPDQFLGAHVRRETGRDNLHVWLGECHVHAGISPDDVRRQVRAHPDAELLVHPECGCATSALWLADEGVLPRERTQVLSTGGMVEAARRTTADTVLVATEIGMLHQLRKARPGTTFLPMNERASCRYMKMTTPDLLLRCLREGRDEVDVPPDLAARARAAVEAMLAIGEPGGGE
ncbi:MAG TPA: quinolinate synthase NadA [Nocardioides sp.]|jgi:quinolinate synthase|uniref:quinolinate synthase NadA n=1 Tax=Nocardioides sp. TaxID=35761 RepID=UPI002E362D1A|nr:quinolinate synthase NadA [Nocardioides sp.]HEX3931085.1 quinolinate synthase NadA [Nocardioides sp.]